MKTSFINCRSEKTKWNNANLKSIKLMHHYHQNAQQVLIKVKNNTQCKI